MAPTRHDGTAPDDQQLAAMGKKQELKRNFSPLSMLGLAFAILNSWTALSASLGLALPSGGSTSVLWGLVTAGICNLCLASSLAEFLSAYPTVSKPFTSPDLRELTANHPIGWWPIPLGSCHQLEIMGAHTQLGHWLD
jgi:amino acid permease